MKILNLLLISLTAVATLNFSSIKSSSHKYLVPRSKRVEVFDSGVNNSFHNNYNDDDSLKTSSDDTDDSTSSHDSDYSDDDSYTLAQIENALSFFNLTNEASFKTAEKAYKGLIKRKNKELKLAVSDIEKNNITQEIENIKKIFLILSENQEILPLFSKKTAAISNKKNTSNKKNMEDLRFRTKISNLEDALNVFKIKDIFKETKNDIDLIYERYLNSVDKYRKLLKAYLENESLSSKDLDAVNTFTKLADFPKNFDLAYVTLFFSNREHEAHESYHIITQYMTEVQNALRFFDINPKYYTAQSNPDMARIAKAITNKLIFFKEAYIRSVISKKDFNDAIKNYLLLKEIYSLPELTYIASLPITLHKKILNIFNAYTNTKLNMMDTTQDDIDKLNQQVKANFSDAQARTDLNLILEYLENQKNELEIDYTLPTKKSTENTHHHFDNDNETNLKN